MSNYIKKGRRYGEQHPRTKLSNQDVVLMRELHDEHGVGYRKLAAKFECGISTARDIATHRTRI